MAKTKRGFIFATSFTSGIAAILSLVSLGTHYWLVSDGEISLSDKRLNDRVTAVINYGLFFGVLEVKVYNLPSYYELTLTCRISDNACAFLCKSSSEARQDELKRLINGELVDFDNNCPQVVRTNRFYNIELDNQPQFKNSIAKKDRQFINGGLYISTVIFLGISAICGVFSSGLSVWNTAANPIEAYFNIFGLYIYNTVAALSILMTICLWGAYFGDTLVKNICILYTIIGEMNTENMASLGFSYWLNLVSLLLYIISIIVLFVRQYLIEQEPRSRIYDDDINNAGDIIIY